MSMTEDVHQWSSIEKLATGFQPAWVGDEWEKDRLAAYILYEALYLNVPLTLAVAMRGNNDNPIYIPSARQIIDTLNRYLARGIDFIPDPTLGTTAQQQSAALVLRETLRRERFASKFSTNKLEGTYRGDWLWHVYADPNLPAGARISILPIDPGMVFPEYNEENIDEVTGYKIADEYVTERGDHWVRILRYWKETGKGGPSVINVSDNVYKPDKTGLPGVDLGSPETVLRNDEQLPSPIDHLPLYHIANTSQTGTVFGRSELQGLERLVSAISQSISDEELHLALEGLGVYWTDSGHPVDANDDPVAWDLGPARVVEVQPNSKFGRVQGVGTVQPSQDHLRYLHKMLDGVSGTPAIAKGDVDVQVAESGIALVLQMGPLLAKCEDKEIIIEEVHRNMMWDLPNWFAAYEDRELASLWLPQTVSFIPIFGQKLPVNHQQRFNELLQIWQNRLTDAEWVWEEMAKIGYDFGDPTEMRTRLDARMDAEAALVDPMGDRLSQEEEEDEDAPTT